MADHVRKQLREAVGVALTGLATTGTNVFESRSIELQSTQLPALRIYTEAEEASQFLVTAPRTYERLVQLRVVGVVQSTGAVDDALDQIAKEVEIALSAGVTVDGHTIEMDYQGCSIEFDTETEKPLGEITMNFTATLYTLASTPDALT